AEETIIRADKNMLVSLNHNGAACRAYARINHGQMNRAWRKVVPTSTQREGPSVNILRWDVVCQVYNLCLRIKREDDAFDGGHEIVGSAKVSEQSNHLEGR